jgi:hypothetical protein
MWAYLVKQQPGYGYRDQREELSMKSIVSIIKRSRVMEFILFSNYFYGICAVALTIEATLQQRFPLNGFIYLGLIFMATVLYYAHPYIRKCSYISSNPRTNWYTKHYDFMRGNQIVITGILVIALALFVSVYRKEIVSMSLLNWAIVFIFPMAAASYYGIRFLSKRYNIRKIGWLKPFVIGFIWAGLVTDYPVLFYDIINNQDYVVNEIAVLLFTKNFMFVSVLCIMFDIKDYSADYLHRIKTFVVKIGLRNTIFYILLPLSVIGLLSFILYATNHHFSAGRIILNTIPFLLLLWVAWSLRKRRPLLYYLSVVDGLMLVKAICGIIAITYF